MVSLISNALEHDLLLLSELEMTTEDLDEFADGWTTTFGEETNIKTLFNVKQMVSSKIEFNEKN